MILPAGFSKNIFSLHSQRNALNFNQTNITIQKFEIKKKFKLINMDLNKIMNVVDLS